MDGGREEGAKWVLVFVNVNDAATACCQPELHLRCTQKDYWEGAGRKETSGCCLLVLKSHRCRPGHQVLVLFDVWASTHLSIHLPLLPILSLILRVNLGRAQPSSPCPLWGHRWCCLAGQWVGNACCCRLCRAAARKHASDIMTLPIALKHIFIFLLLFLLLPQVRVPNSRQCTQPAAAAAAPLAGRVTAASGRPLVCRGCEGGEGPGVAHLPQHLALESLKLF